ncbi:MAG TPA: hypothetical protein VJP40_03430 [bacterium]|nr:hypothetical protein [bacterium]
MRARLAPELRPDGEPGSGTVRAVGPAEESQPAIQVRDGEFRLEDDGAVPREELEPLSDSDSETDFSGIAAEEAPPPRTDSTPTIVPPSGNSGARPAPQPPPLPQRSGSRTDLNASVSRGSDSAEPFVLLRRRVNQIRNSQTGTDNPTATSAVQIDGASNYESFARNIDLFFLQLFTAHRNAPADQRYFDIEVTPNGEMHIIDGPLFFRHEGNGYSYFSLFRNMPDPETPHRVEFLLERLHLSDEHHAMGWDAFFRGTFLPMQSNQRRAP